MIWSSIWLFGGAFYWIGSTMGWWWGFLALIPAVLLKTALSWGLVAIGLMENSWIPADGKVFSFFKWIPAPLAAYATWLLFGAPSL